MKARLLLLLFSPLLFAGCAQEKPSGSIPTVDVTASYPEKTITLQDFADVEYIPLETSDEFLTEGVILASGEKYILVKNSSNDGNIYLFDRTGKGVRVINHKGNGPGEYTNYNDVLHANAVRSVVNQVSGWKVSYGGSVPISLVRYNIEEKLTISYLNLDALEEFIRLRSQLYFDARAIITALEQDCEILEITNDEEPYSNKQQAIEIAVSDELKAIQNANGNPYYSQKKQYFQQFQ